ncbi:hypothetical protein [Acinetobacter celticus]|uniref:Uncharacterized protein n=1 Tax=Acinetobacter celticus TaxID=1891224 RepID=A0A1C3CXV5_9GAMM|nr:hypothetical protein [Acinetobacter celticus]MBP8099453.1 hypothetical protein [Acinetobacter sp.]MBP8206313.1 hypothetical protein [Acinetobacter sp.]ODA13655.1 hypothetical protein BBP83_04550 [Acinetobacter celticus]
MKKNIVCLCIFYLFSSTALQATDIEETKFYDLFSGTIHQRANQLFLKRCDLSQYEYPLHFNHTNDQAKIEHYLKQHPKFWVNIRGDVYEKQELYHLTIEEILDVHPNQSCHLLDLFEE